MDDNKQYVVALEISSSKIVGVLGVPNSNGGVEVLDIEAERSPNCVRYGCIQNVEETKVRINRVLTRLEARISPKKITGVYVGINGRSVHNHSMSISASFDEERMITENVVESLKKRFASEADVQGDILEVLPCKYFVDNTEITNPIGAYGTSVRIEFNGVVARSALKMNIDRAIDSRFTIKGYIVTSLAMAEHILSNEDRQLGCMLVDFGAETTAVSIYRNGVLQYFATLPMGSRLITRDIASLNVLEEVAEEIKRTSGNAMVSTQGRSSILVDGLRSTDVQNYVSSRSQEIVANINEQISYSGLSRDQIASGIVLVGGGVQLNGFGRLVSDMTKLKVRQGSIPVGVSLHDSAALGIEYLQVISILQQAANIMEIGDSCVTDPVVAAVEGADVVVEEPESATESDSGKDEIQDDDGDVPLKIPEKNKIKTSSADKSPETNRVKGGDNDGNDDDDSGEILPPNNNGGGLRAAWEKLRDKLMSVFEESKDAYADDDADSGDNNRR